MNKKRIAQYCCAAIVTAGIGLNIQNATTNYGISENRLALMAVGGSNSVSGTWIDSVISWIDSIIHDITTPTPEPEPKSLKCELEEVTPTTPTTYSNDIPNHPISCGPQPSGHNQTTTSGQPNNYVNKRWICVYSEDGDMTPSECQPKCLSKNPK